MAVHVEGFCGPEHDDRKEIRAGDEGDHESQTQGTRLLLQPCRENRVFGTVNFPEGKGDEQKEANDQRGQNVSGGPGIL